MQKNFIALACTASMCFLTLSAQTAQETSVSTQTYPQLSQADLSRFDQLMQQAINAAEKRVETAQHFATRHDVSPTWDSKLEYQQAITMLEVKKTLMNNFKGTESLRSSAVRTKLLNLLNSSDITTADLANLQNLVLNEKERIRDEDQKFHQLPQTE